MIPTLYPYRWCLSDVSTLELLRTISMLIVAKYNVLLLGSTRKSQSTLCTVRPLLRSMQKGQTVVVIGTNVDAESKHKEYHGTRKTVV